MILADDVLVYPAHGAGSLCGKGLSEASSSTIGDEKLSDVALNIKGASALDTAIENISIQSFKEGQQLDAGILIVDSRPAAYPGK